MATWKLTVSVDPKVCIGAAACVGSAPHLFKLDEDNVAYLVDPLSQAETRSLTLDATDQEKQVLMDAVQNCPTSAISLVTAAPSTYKE